MKFTINLTGCVFDENHAVTGGAIHLNDTKEIPPEDIIDDESDSDEGHDEDYDYEEDPMPTYTISNCIFKNSVAVHGLIYAHIIDTLSIIDSTFEDSSSEEGTAVYKALGGEIEILNSTFINLHAKASGGAVAMIQANALTIENSSFVNVTSHNSGGAIACDVYFEHPDNEGRIKITGSEFANSKSGFGGAIAVAGGKLNVTDCIFNGNLAQHSGGAIYTSQTLVRVSNSTFKGNALDSSKGKGSAISTIFRQVTVDNSRFIDNHDNAVCLLENGYSITNSLFENNTEAIYSTFAESSFLENNTFGDDTISENVTDSTYYVLVVNSTGARMDLIENEIDTENLPEYFNSADWGWVTPIKNQYESGACWVFATTAALESALLKSTGIGYEFSINNLHKNMLLYSRYGHSAIAEAGLETVVAEFMLSWYGPIPLEYEAFSVCGKISTPVLASDAIHIQDVVWVKPRQNLTDNDHLKRAIMKYGAFTTSLSEIHQGDVFNQNTSSLYNHADGFGGTNHAIAIVGWDDNYPAENFVVDPPGNGAWICKNSFGQESYDKGYMYVSYYDTPFGFSDIVAFSIQNTESYTKNYQTDIIGTVILLSESDSYVYKNTYESIDDDFISAVGTYFLENESYDLEIHVNGVLKHSQSGNAPFCGFHTVKLESGVPVKKGDTFEIVMKKSSLPLVNETLMRFGEGRSIVYEEGGVRDLALENATASLKAYAKPLVNLTAQIAAADVNTVYNGGKYLTVTVRDVYGDAIAGINVTVGLSNGATKTIATDAKGQARFSTDNLAPKTYTATISTPAFANYLKTSQTAKVTVKKAAVKLTVKPKAFKKSAKAKRYSVTLKTNKNKAMKNVRLALKVNKKTYYAKTNRKGVATFKITKLAKKGKFNAAITYNGNSCYAKLTKKAKITVR